MNSTSSLARGNVIARPKHRIRLRHRRRGIGRMRARQSAERGRQDIRCCCSRRVRRTPISGSTCRSAMASCSRKKPSTGCTRPSRSRDWTGEACFSRAARCWADRVRSTACCTCAASTRITIAGASAAMPAGAMTTCCPISRRPKTSSAAPTNIHGAGGPLPVSDLAACRSAVGSLRRGRRGDRHPRQSRFQRRGPGRRRIFPDHDAARPARQHRVVLSSSRQGPQQSARRDLRAGAAHPVRGTPRATRSNTGRVARCERRGRARKSWSPAAPTTRRNCCSSPASVPRNCLKQHGIDVVLDAPGVGNDLQDHLQVRIVMRCSQTRHAQRYRQSSRSAG